MEPMWFYDEADDADEWRSFRQQAQALEAEHLRLRTALRDAEAALRERPEDSARSRLVDELRSALEEMERKAPWLASDLALELALWGVPHG